VSHGATDDPGYYAVEDVVHVRGLQATMMYQPGIDDLRYTVRHQGLDMRLTGVEKTKVIPPFFA